jgi:hypothetical protein
LPLRAHLHRALAYGCELSLHGASDLAAIVYYWPAAIIDRDFPAIPRQLHRVIYRPLSGRSWMRTSSRARYAGQSGKVSKTVNSCVALLRIGLTCQ